MISIKTIIFFFVFCLEACLLNGCATTNLATLPTSSGMSGIYHRVEKGQTLWRISKLYNVDLDVLVSTNHIPDSTNIEVGQLIFIPSRQKPQIASGAPSYEDFVWPVRGKVVSSFGQSSSDMVNKGINIQPYSESDVVAARKGKVVFYSPNFKSFGKTIIIDHGDGFSTVYAKNSAVFIKVGEIVNQGTVISKIDMRDKNTSGYLHFEIRKSHTPQNPYFYLQ